MGLLDEAKNVLNSATNNNNNSNNYEKGSERYSNLGDNNSDRTGSGGRNQSSGGNINADDSRYAQGGIRSDQSLDSTKSGSGGTGSRYNEDNSVGLGYEGRESTRASQADSYGDSGLERTGGGYGSTGLSGQGDDDVLSDNFGARGGVRSGGVEDSRDSVSSGGYGANAQGDSFSRKNQSGFDNEFSSSGGY
ncbi:hypothetical protein PCANC_22196 [Puccinia coronata f. sp. avenae]|uniref:Uncharacterized protein n=1 Tax=Puccinia coronata f. sp. avenae TaxID=200324 RepID=A0A2N5SJM6_9BASI|nr:hypothetical protein PCASD_23330 [Puccinia coronata f. sp. avenae]PLW13426.1 hypothetical protein PCANC_22196 [Puccinia coronata f. sp. avenae]